MNISLEGYKVEVYRSNVEVYRVNTSLLVYKDLNEMLYEFTMAPLFLPIYADLLLLPNSNKQPPGNYFLNLEQACSGKHKTSHEEGLEFLLGINNEIVLKSQIPYPPLHNLNYGLLFMKQVIDKYIFIDDN